MENREVRLIDAELYRKALKSEMFQNNAEHRLDIQRAIILLDQTPTIIPARLRPHGKWFECDYVEYDGHSECIHYPKAALGCTNCRNAFKKELLWKRNYCPNCGANMEDSNDQIEPRY